ncbi:CPBP family intramembrane glutamic endopeptidase [Ramlibacter rhizophilus]|uniref:CPBP family intramembrane metalloprotease n=1 Tax=Ramlibacter rhizophilus TaxID=1781167 RepID=A0A4Z0BJC4_9BURK|nr:CPBP family intramembrane glutamic endopeptidase [Ramlibacter rhizophilus]TFY97998.1 CPBP family intramembrane metalloprotease [Ramlibacter rhizophilus]
MAQTFPTTLAPFGRRFAGPWAASLLGLAALAFQLHGQLGSAPLPPQLAGLPAPVLLALSLLNPLLLLTVSSLLGAALAHRVGLGSLLAGTAAPVPPRAWWQAAGTGLLLALALRGLDLWMQPGLDPEGRLLSGSAPMPLPQLAVGLFYGGLAEEVLARWGWLVLVAWLLHKLARRGTEPLGAAAFWTANVVAALLFAAGHLPALATVVELTPGWVVRTLALNAGAGLVYGWLFRRSGLEVAMAAHAATHVGFWLLSMR